MDRRLIVLHVVLLLGCSAGKARELDKAVYFTASDYCVSWNFALGGQVPGQADGGVVVDGGFETPPVDALSADLAALDMAVLDEGRYEPVAPPSCREVQSEGGVTEAATVLAAAGLVAEVPVLPAGHRYRLVGGFYANDGACAAEAFLVCAISREFVADDDPLSLYLLCPPIGEDQCTTRADCLPGALCLSGTCQDLAPDDLLGTLPITYDVCRSLHAEVLAAGR